MVFLPGDVKRRCGEPETGLPLHAKRSGANAGADRTRHPGAAESAIAGRILGEILLMIVLREIEFGRWRDLRGDGSQTLCRQRLLIGRAGCIGCFALRVAESVDRGTILGADVIALTHALRRVVTFPKRLQELVVRDFLRIEHHQHRFGMTGAARTDLLVSGVFGVTAGVAHGGGIDAIAEFPKLTLRAPETAEPERRLLQACRIRRLQLTAVHEMPRCSRDRVLAARQRLGYARQCSGFAHEQHGLPPGGMSVEKEPLRITGPRTAECRKRTS